MNIIDYLKPESVVLGAGGNNREDVLHEIAVHASQSPVLKPVLMEDIYQALVTRENIGSTGFGGGIAIPHCSFDTIKDFVIGIVTKPEGIDFNAYDKKPTRVFFYIIGPQDQRRNHIYLLSTFSKIMKTPGSADQLCNATSPQQVIDLFTEKVQPMEEVVSHKEKCLFQVMIQRDEFFQDILQIFAAAGAGSVTVLETVNAGHYLHSLPLFSALWGEDTRKATRLILAVTDKSFCNDIIRRIQMIDDTITTQPGVLITAQDMLYSSGSIDF
jgi:PTS system nitrogen regulatory IIA component